MLIRDVVALGCRCFLASLLPVRSKMNSQRLVFSMAVIGVLAVFGLMGGDLFLAHPVQADDENVVTVLSGTDAADTMTLADPIDAQAGLLTDESEKIKASATALDAQAGSDVILSGADVAVNADATALLLQILDAKTQALAKAMGLVAGDDNDMITSSGALAVTSLASGAYAGALTFDTGDRDGDDRKIDLSLSTEAGSTAIDGGDGDDMVNNDGALAASATATSGGTVDQLTADAQGAVSLNATSSAKAETTGIATGDGDDAISSTNTIASIATATSGALGMSLAAGENAEGDKAKIELDTSASAEATAIGIESDGDEAAQEDKDASPFGLDGLRVTYEKETTAVSGADSIANVADMQAVAVATSGAGSASMDIDVDGTVQSKANSEAKSVSVGISSGGAQDAISNSGDLNATATATAGALSAAVRAGGSDSGSTDPPDPNETNGDDEGRKTSSESQATATARAIGVDSDGKGQTTTLSAAVEITDESLILTYRESEAFIGESDHVTNLGNIQAMATAETSALNAAVDLSATGAVNSKANSHAKADGVGVNLGGGDDHLINTGQMTASADAIASALNVAIGIPQDSSSSGSTTTAPKIKATADGSAASESRAIGLSADGVAGDTTREAELSIGGDGLSLLAHQSEIRSSGNDVVINLGGITATSNATTEALGLGISIDGKASAKVSASSEARAIAIDLGGGDDIIESAGPLTATAESRASALNVAIGVPQDASSETSKTNTIAKSDVTAQATAIGLAADGHESRTTDVSVGIGSDEGLTIAVAKTTTDASGADQIVNHGSIDATAISDALSASVAFVAKKGIAATVSNVESQAQATAIQGGDDDDDIYNDGDLVTNAEATAVAAAVSIAEEGTAISIDSVWDGGTTAEASAVGIDADGGHIEKASITELRFFDGPGATIIHETSFESASGHDRVINNGDIDVTATAIAGSANVAFSSKAKGLAVALSQSTGEASATAVRGGDGDDRIDNTGNLSSTATATAIAASVAVETESGAALAGNAVWDGGVTAAATAIGIDADGGMARSQTIKTVHAGFDGVDVNTATPVSGHANGNDVINNTGQIDTSADATVAELSVAIAVKGVAGAISTSTANARAVAIDAGRGNDQVDNSGVLHSTATAAAAAVNFAFTQEGLAVAANDVWDGGVDAKASAIGIDGGVGIDGIDNLGEIAADSDATAFAFSAAGAVKGGAAAVSTSTAESTATAIDAGAGQDDETLFNAGQLTADAMALAGTVNVAAVNQGAAIAADAVWDGGTQATATAKGIDVGLGADTVVNEGEVAALSDATAASAAVSVAMEGVAVATATSTATSKASAIDTGAGNDADAVENSGHLTAEAEALAAAASVSFTTAGVAVASDSVWDGGTKAKAIAKGIDVGLGSDVVSNEGDINARADATTASVAASIAISGVAGAVANATGESFATAIDTGGGVAADDVTNSGRLTATSNTTAVSAAIGFTTEGVAVAGNAAWDGGTRATAAATGIDVGGGADRVSNAGEIEATSGAVSDSTAVSVAVAGVAGAVSTATAEANAKAIDGGDGADEITNDSTGELISQADATAIGVNVTVAGEGVAVSADAVWDGGRGADGITNDAAIDAAASSNAVSASVAITGAGVSAATATTSSTATAIAIDSGDDADLLHNSGDLTATSRAAGTGISVSATGSGVALAADAFWDGGTRANAIAAGIAAGAGDDRVANTADRITAAATSETTSVAIAVTGTGLAGAAAASTSTANATAIAAGQGSDSLVNSGALDATATSTAEGISVAFASEGAALAGSFVDNATTAEAVAIGLAGGDGHDRMTNNDGAEVNLTGSAEVTDTAVSVGLVGMAGADSQALAVVQASGIDGGDGNDTLVNSGSITGTDVTAESTARGISFAIAGAALSSANATAEASAVGIAGGQGTDRITNNGLITLGPQATTSGQTVGVSAIGAAINDANATSYATATGLDGGRDRDTIINNSAIDAAATSIATAKSTGVVIGGYSLNQANTTAHAEAIGIDGGEEDDDLTNADAGSIAIAADAQVFSKSLTISVLGDASGEANTTAESTATGLRGGTGDDAIANRRDVTVSATASGNSAGASIGLFGSTQASAASTVDAVATGIDGGDGEDVIDNDADINVGASTIADASSLSLNLGGAGEADAGARAMALAIGIAGGGDGDDITNRGHITAFSEASAFAVSETGGLAGDAQGNASTEATAMAYGIEGGSAADYLYNGNDVTVHAKSFAQALSASSVLFGGAGSQGGTLSHAAATGISGGSEEDWIINAGDITISPVDPTATDVMSEAIAESSTWTLIGDAQATATVTATGHAVGIDGGAGDDRLENTAEASITAFMKTHARADGNGEGGFIGSPEAVSTSRAEASATGIAGGEGADWIYTLGFIHAEAQAIADADSDADVFAGNPRAESTTRIGATAAGIDAGTGSNGVWNGGTVRAVTSIETRPYAAADSDIASNRADSSSDLAINTVGIRSGAESDRVVNAMGGAVNVDVTAIATPFATSDESSTAQVGGGSDSPTIIQAMGIDVGDGDNAIANDGPVTVNANVVARPRAESRSLTLTATSRAYLSLLTDITGLKAGTGDDQVINANVIDVAATVDGTAYAGPRSGEGSHTDHAYAEVGRPDRPLDLQVAGIDAQAGDNEIVNFGRITAVLQNEENLPITAQAHADTDTTRNSAEAKVGFVADAVGIRSGAGNDDITNAVDAAIAVHSNLAVVANARADEDASAVAGGEADSAWVLNSQASGIDAGEGRNNVANFGNIDVAAIEDIHAVASASSTTMTASADAQINASVDALGMRTGAGDDVLGSFGEMTILAQVDGLVEALERNHTNNATAGSEDAFLTAEAKGIDAGGGQNNIFVQGRLETTAEANSESYAEAECDTCTENAQAFARARAAAEGIAAGDGINRIAIEGTMETRALSSAVSTARAPERYGPDEFATADSEARASAYGVLIAGNQDSVIHNMGSMTVASEAETAVAIQGGPDYRTTREYAESTAMGIRTGNGQHVILNDGDIVVSASIQGNSSDSLHAIGIQTGSGHDIILNNGSVTTSVEDLNGTMAGVAITTGAGNDVVALMGASETTGSADLGDGDDRLNLVEDAALAGDASGGVGRDAFVLYGQGFYGGAIDGFETATKYDAGTFGLNGLPTMNELSVYDGVLQTQGGYTFDENGSALVRIHVDGFGQFQVADTVELAGALSVLAEPRVFHNGQIFPIIQSGGLLGTFDEVSLPETRPLLGFELNYNYNDQQVEVATSTRPFRTVARNANERAIADYLDRIAPGATGEMSRVLGEFQTLQGNQFGEAFAGMSPASYGSSTGAALNTARLNSQVVSNRMQSLWSGAATRQAEASSSSLDGILLAYNGPNASLGNLVGRQEQVDARRRWGAWANVYGQWTTQDADDGFVGYDSDTYGVVLGMDYAFSETWLAGLSFGYASNDLNFDTNAGDGDIESYFGSLYTGWYRDAFYLESVLTYGSQAYDNKRNVVVGATRYTAHSDHDGNLYSAYLGSGYNFGDDGWNVGPFVSLEYLYLDEDGFEESGAGVLNLIVDDRQTDALISQLGVRASSYVETGVGALIPELSLAWLYDFDIDDRVITSSFAGASGDAFSITGQEVEQNGVVVGAALTLMQVNGIESSLTYSGEFRDGYDAHALIGQIRIAF